MAGPTTAIDGWVTWAAVPVGGARIELRTYEPDFAEGRFFSSTITTPAGYFFLRGVDPTIRQDVVFPLQLDYAGVRKHVDMKLDCTVAHFGPVPNSFEVFKQLAGLSLQDDAIIPSAPLTITWDPVSIATRYCLGVMTLPEGRLMLPRSCPGSIWANAGSATTYTLPAFPPGRYHLQASAFSDGVVDFVATAVREFSVR